MLRTRSADLLRVPEVAVRGMPEAIVQQQPAKQEASARLECGTPAEALLASPSDAFHWSSGTTASGDQLFVQIPDVLCKAPTVPVLKRDGARPSPNGSQCTNALARA